MSSTEAEKHKKVDGFLEKVDWDKYTSYRPKYPPSLEKLIMDYHRAHSNSLRMAHDVGSGSGVFAPTLAEYFQHVHVSDPKPAFIVQARQRLDQWFAEHWWKGRFTFSVTAAENADEVAAKRSVDLVSLMQCVHWTDQDRTVESVAASLAPNGTMAIVAYNPAPAVVGNELTNQAVRQLFAFWADNIIDAAGGKESMLAKKFIPQENSGVESILLPDGLFIQDVTKRIEINITGRGEAPHALPGNEHLMRLSRANPLHRRYEYSSKEREGEGWKYEVDASWFRGYTGTLEQESRLHLYEEHLQEIEKIVKDTAETGKVTIEWTVAILLATRK